MGVQLPTEHKYKRRLSSWRGWGCLWALFLICPQTAKAQVTPQPGVADWVNAVLTAHPLVRARAEEARAAEADVSAARWQYWPTPSVNTDTLRGQSANRSVEPDEDSVWRLKAQDPHQRVLFYERIQASYTPAAAFNAAALSVFSQLNSGSSRPKWP